MGKLIRNIDEKKLRANHQRNAALNGETIDLEPVVKFFNPVGAATWLISELDDDGIAFGLCDLGFGSPELGYVSVDELAVVKVGFGLGIERDRHFTAKKTLGEYAAEAREKGSISA